jgi:DUF4097 and DUF4098 domain-containing protein YvlB
MNRRRIVLGIALLVTVFAFPVLAGGKEVIFDETYNVQKGWNLELAVSDMDVTIAPGKSDEAHVKVTLTGNIDKARERFEKMNFESRLKGQTLEVETRDNHNWSSGWWGSSNWGIRITVTIPEEFDMTIRTSDGDIEADGITGDINIQTSDGDVTIGKLEGPSIYIKSSDGDLTADGLIADDVDLRTSDGDVRTDLIKGGDVSLSSSDGDVTADRIEAELTSVRSSDGDLRIKIAGGDLRGRTSDGNIDVWIENNTSVDLSTSDGDIVIHAPSDLAADIDLKGEDVHMGGKILIEGDISEHRIQGKIGNGGKKVRARTSDGTVSLRFI